MLVKYFMEDSYFFVILSLSFVSYFGIAKDELPPDEEKCEIVDIPCAICGVAVVDHWHTEDGVICHCDYCESIWFDETGVCSGSK